MIRAEDLRAAYGKTQVLHGISAEFRPGELWGVIGPNGSGKTTLLRLGADAAGSLGMHVGRMRFLLLALASVLAGAAVSFAGLLGFVGLLAPHIARRLVGGSHRRLLPVCAVGGATLVLLCDLAARALFAPYEVPVGILLSLVGGPFFLFLLLRSRKGARA